MVFEVGVIEGTQKDGRVGFDAWILSYVSIRIFVEELFPREGMVYFFVVDSFPSF